MQVCSFVLMCIAILLQGAYLFVRDAVTPDLPFAFLASDLVWTAALFSLAFYWRYPRLVVVSTWILFVTFAIILEPFAPRHTAAAFFNGNCLMISYVAFGHSALYFRRKSTDRVME